MGFLSNQGTIRDRTLNFPEIIIRADKGVSIAAIETSLPSCSPSFAKIPSRPGPGKEKFVQSAGPRGNSRGEIT
jgi:hypothetical protein